MKIHQSFSITIIEVQLASKLPSSLFNVTYTLLQENSSNHIQFKIIIYPILQGNDPQSPFVFILILFFSRKVHMPSIKISLPYPYHNLSTPLISWLNNQCLSILKIPTWLMDYHQPFIQLIPLIFSFSKKQ